MSPYLSQKIVDDFTEAVKNLVTEDDEPVDSIFSAQQQRLLVQSLYSGWTPPPDKEEDDEHFEPDPSSSQYVLRPSPLINKEGLYEVNASGRNIVDLECV